MLAKKNKTAVVGDTGAVGEALGVPTGMIDALEAGFEGWGTRGGVGRFHSPNRSAKAITAHHGIAKRLYVAAYRLGEMLAEKLGVEGTEDLGE